MTGHTIPALRVVIPCLCLSAALVILWCPPALAHARLTGSDPAADATLNGAPAQVRLRFNEPVEAEFSPVGVYDAGGDRVDEDDARVDPDDARVVLVGLGRDLPDGSYSVEWRVTSIDGHVIEGTYEFAVGDTGARGTSEATRTDAGNTGAGTAPQPAREDEGQEAGVGGAHGRHYVALGCIVLVMLVAVVLRRR
jgi:methionine-rich copper-binding protein CopC